MPWTLVALAAGWTLVFEALTCAGRFGLGLRSRVYAGLYLRYTFGVRVHHAYFAAPLLPAALLTPLEAGAREFAVAVALGLVFSDLLHHFIVLPLLTGERD